MKKMNFRTRLWLPIILSVLLIGVTTFAVGKYIKTISVQSTVTFTAKLAESVVLTESKIKRNTDGTYETTGETIAAGEIQPYSLIPGLDVPKDPHIIITGKTAIPAYLYIEIVDSTIDTYDSQPVITYSVISDWTAATDAEMPPQHGGIVYKYNTKLNTAFDKQTYYILTNNEVTVSQHLKHADTDGTDLLTFYAYLVEATD